MSYTIVLGKRGTFDKNPDPLYSTENGFDYTSLIKVYRGRYTPESKEVTSVTHADSVGELVDFFGGRMQGDDIFVPKSNLSLVTKLVTRFLTNETGRKYSVRKLD